MGRSALNNPDLRADPRMCVWKNGKAFPSPNIATHRGKALVAAHFSDGLALCTSSTDPPFVFLCAIWKHIDV